MSKVIKIGLRQLSENIIMLIALLVHKKIISSEELERAAEKLELAKMGGAKKLEDVAHDTLHLLDGTDCLHKPKKRG